MVCEQENYTKMNNSLNLLVLNKKKYKKMVFNLKCIILASNDAKNYLAQKKKFSHTKKIFAQKCCASTD